MNRNLSDAHCLRRRVRGHSQRALRPGASAAFTLIELLVVVSIIALLIAILLPSLKNAREQAKTVKCMANVRSITQGASTYQSEFNGWLAGSAGTSGSAMYGGGGKAAPGDAEEVRSNLVQIWDWAMPMGNVKNAPTLRSDRFKMIAETYLCPSNAFLSLPFYEGTAGPRGNFKVQPLISYNTIRQYMMWPKPDRFGVQDYDWGGRAPVPEASDTIPNATYTARNYRPKIDRVGNPSLHVYISDSSRFTTDSGNLDHDIHWKAGFGGAFSDGGPTLKSSFGDESPGFLRAFRIEPLIAPLTYRHKQTSRIGVVVGYFDGHSGFISEDESRHPDAWWPKGTEIPVADMNTKTRLKVFQQLVQGVYTVKR